MAKGVQASYTGASGQMAVMAELLARRCNVAIPVVDTGEDVFVFLDGWSDFIVIQRGELNALREANDIGSHNRERDEIQLHFSFRSDSLMCSKVDFRPVRNAWNHLAVVRAVALQAPPAPPAPD